MRTTEERVLAVKQRAARQKQQKQTRSERWKTVVIVACSLVLVIFLSVLFANLPTAAETDLKLGMTASIFAENQMLPYVMIGLIAFALGVCCTLLCIKIKKQKQIDDEEK